MAFTSDVRTIVDPLFIRFREELMGSGVSFGRIVADKLPVTVVYTDTLITTVDAAGYIKGITTQSGGTTVGTDQKTLRFYNAQVSSVGNVTTIVIPSGSVGSSGMANPMTTLGDMITAASGGSPQRLAVGSNGQVLAVVAGQPGWLNLSLYTDPLTTNGDMLYRTAGVTTRLPIGNNGEVLTVVGNTPTWINPASGTGSNIIVESYDGNTAVIASRIKVPDAMLVTSGTAAIIRDAPGWYLDYEPRTVHAKTDEFQGTSLNAKWISPATPSGAVSVMVDNSWVFVEPAAAGAASTSSRGGFAIRQAAPSGSFTIMAKIVDQVSVTATNDDALVGIFVATTAGSALGHMFGYRTSLNRIAEVLDFTYSETAAWGAWVGYNPRITSDTPWFGTWYKIVWSSGAGSLTFYYSANGTQWKSIGTRTGLSAPTAIGLGLWANTANIYADHGIAVDWFRVSEP